MQAPHQVPGPNHLVSLTLLIPLHLCRLHSEELGGPPLKKLKQEVGFPGCMKGVSIAFPQHPPLPGPHFLIWGIHRLESKVTLKSSNLPQALSPMHPHTAPAWRKTVPACLGRV